MSDAVRVERTGPDGSVARVTLARPATRNAFDAEIIGALHEAMASLAGESPADLRVVVLAGEGRAFCAGADVAWMTHAGGQTAAENETDARRLWRMLAAIDACPVPVVARVQGAAIGGGAGLCAVADVVLADAGAVFAFPEVRLGVVPATIAPFVVRRIGEGPARALFTTGRRIDAAEGRTIGLVHRVLDGEAALDAAVEETIEAILAGAPEAVRAAKALVRDVAGLARGDDGHLETLTSRLLAERRASDEGQQGLAAFRDRRPAPWVAPDGDR